MQIGSHILKNNLIVAPMAGVTDRPFRQLCKRLGAGLAVSEMLASNPSLRGTHKSRLRADHQGEAEPISVQIAGADPEWMADAGQPMLMSMICAGSALLKDEALVGRILDAVVGAVAVPVTLKIRTGWDPHQRNAVRVARIAQSAGVRALAVHGRTRACGFTGMAEYETIAAVKAQVGIPVVANGDVDGPEKAKQVLEKTQADAIMIGRAAQGRPWIFREITHYLASGQKLPAPEVGEVRRLLLDHLNELYALYGEAPGVRIARKHICWYTRELVGSAAFRQSMNRLETASEQTAAVGAFFNHLAEGNERLAYGEEELAA